MDNIKKQCKKCGKELKPSQYLPIVEEGELVKEEKDNLVCRNYPNCPDAEKEVD